MNQTLHDMKKTLAGMVDVSSRTKQHPWIVTGSAVAVGFVTGAALTPSRGANVKKRRSNSKAEFQSGCDGQETATARKSFLFSTLGKGMMGILKAVVEGLLAAALVSKERVEMPPPQNSAGVVAAENGTE
jgi:hypothetical protein